MVKQIGILLLALLIGCATEETKSDVMKSFQDVQASVCVDHAFTVKMPRDVAERFSSEVTEATQAWQKQLGGKVTFQITEDDSTKEEWVSCDINVVWQNDSKAGVWGEALAAPGKDGKTVAAVVYLASSLQNADGSTVNATLLHEFGHALGLGHDEDINDLSVMWRFITDTRGMLGCEDVRRACDIWGCVPTCEGNTWAS